MKRVICLIMIIIIVSVPFCVTAHADITSELIGYFVDWMIGTSTDIGYGDMSADELIDYYNTPAGHAYLDAFEKSLTPPGLPFSFIDLNEYVDTANNKRAWAMKTNADGINALYDNINGYLEWKNTNIRTNDLSDFGLSTYNEIITGGLYTSGPGPVLQVLGSSGWDDGGYYMNVPDDFQNDCVYLYPGSSIYFPVIFVPVNAKLYQNGIALPSGSFYLPLGYDTLIKIRQSFHLKLGYTVGNTIDDIMFRHYSWNWDVLYPEIYKNGSCIGSVNQTVSGYDCVDLLQKMVGVHVDPNGDGAFYEPVAVPDDIPYDDDGYVVISIPYGGGSPTYISYNDYVNNIDNGTYTTDNSIDYGDYFDNSVSNTIINNYYNYNTGGGDFDDSNIVSRLDTIIDKLDKIFSKLSDVYDIVKFSNLSKIEPGDIIDGIGDLFASDDDYVQSEIDWRTLLETKFIIFKQCRELIENLQQHNSPLILESKNPLGVLLSAIPGYDSSKYSDNQNFVVNLNWYEKQYTSPMGTTKSGREYVRDGIGYIFYGITFAYIYRRTDSILADF